jgi:hypothetical protein
VLLWLLPLRASLAQLEGDHTRGTWGLESGSQIPPGLQLSPGYTSYTAGSVRDQNGQPVNLADAPGEVAINSLTAIVWWVSPIKILGAQYGALAMVPFADGKVESAATGFGSSLGVGDLYLQPVNLGWHFKRIDLLASLGVYAPTGSYVPAAADNLGLGMWGYELGVGSTLLFGANKAWSIATTGYFEIHSRKKGTQTRVGDILTLEGGLGRSWFDGNLVVGAAYYAQWKVTDDTLGALAPLLAPTLALGHHGRVLGLGPEVTLPLMIGKKSFGSLNVRYQWEFGARTATQGRSLNVFYIYSLFTGKK